MPRYVDADKIFYRERMTIFYNSKPIKEDVAFKQDIEKVQTEDVAPVVHAHWRLVSLNLWDCTNCHYVVDRWDRKTQYCPDCGAKMDEGVEDD